MRIRHLRAAALAAVLLATVVACDGSTPSAGESSVVSSSAAPTGTEVAPSSDTPSSPATEGSASESAVSSSGASSSDPATSAPSSAPGETASPSSADPTQPPATEFVPGDVNVTVEAVPETTLPAEPLDATVTVGAIATASLGTITEMTAEAIGPGEVAGPAFRVEVHLQNTGDAPLSLDGVTVSAYDKAGTPLVSMTGAPAEPFAGDLPAGGTATAVLVLTHTPEQTPDLSVTVSVRAGEPIALFSGTVPS